MNFEYPPGATPLDPSEADGLKLQHITKVAWRMLHQLRGLMADGGELLQGVVEIDETYIGGKKHLDSRQEQASKKTAVFGTLGEVQYEAHCLVLRHVLV